MADSRIPDAVDAVARHAIAVSAEIVARQIAGMVMLDFHEAASHGRAIEARIAELLVSCDSSPTAAVAASSYLSLHPAGEVQ